MTLLDHLEVQRQKEDAIDCVERGMAPAWRESALAALHALALRRPTLTTDEVWGRLEARPDEPRAMGAIVREGVRRGWIRMTDRMVPSDRPICHGRRIPVWESLLFTESPR